MSDIWGMLQDLRRRVQSTVYRGTLVKAGDGSKMQTLSIRGRANEKIDDVEHWHSYGFSSVPLPPSGDQESEVLVANLGGSSDHPVVIGVADRRHRPKDWQPGEVGLHDDQGHFVKIGRNGIEIIAPAGKTVKQTIGGVTLTLSQDGLDVTGGRITHNGKHIDGTHTHQGVQTGSGNTGEPN